MRQHIGDILSQEQIFAGTLSENISMLREGITFKKVKEAAEQIGLDSFIQQLHAMKVQISCISSPPLKHWN